MLPSPKLTPFCLLKVDLAPIQELGAGRAGIRRIIPIIGGTVSGQVNGTLQNLGADWQTVYADGTAWLDARYAINTDDGATIEVINQGLRHGPAEVMARVAAGEDVDPSDYYMRTSARLETGDARYDWVNRMMFLGVGARKAAQVHIQLYIVE